MAAGKHEVDKGKLSRTLLIVNLLREDVPNCKIMRNILSQGSVVLEECHTSFGENIFHWACRTGVVEIVNDLLTDHNQDVNLTDKSGLHVLHLAAINAHMDVCTLLLNEPWSVDPNVKDEQSWTPLHYACSEVTLDHSNVVAELLKHGADLMAVTLQGKWAIDYIFESGRIQVLIANFPTSKLIEIVIAMRKRKNQKILHTVTRKLSTSDDTPKLKTGLKITNQNWRTIFQKDDVETVQKLIDSTNGCLNNYKIDKSFEENYGLMLKDFSAIFLSCYENTSGLYCYIKQIYGIRIESKDFKSILIDLSGFSESKEFIKNFDLEEALIFQSPETTATFLAFLCGRLELCIVLLQLRNLDTLPLGLLITILARNLANHPNINEQLSTSLKVFSRSIEGIVSDEMCRIFLNDSSPKKSVTLAFLNMRLGCYGNYSMIDLAHKSQCTDFLSLPCCQLALEGRWRYGLSQQSRPWRWFLKIFPILYFVRNCRTEKSETSVEFLKIIQAPSVKHVYHSVLHIIFLFLLAYVVLYDFHFSISTAEGVFIIFLVGYIVEEIRELSLTSVRHYLGDLWNWLDLTAILFSVIALFVRLSYTKEQTSPNLGFSEAHHEGLYAARAMFTISLILFSVRTLAIVSVYYVLGPKLKMLTSMLKKDLLPMLMVFIIFIVGFGVLFQGILFPNGFPIEGERQNGYTILGNVFRRSFYVMLVPNYIVEETTCGKEKNCGSVWGQSLVLYLFNVIYALISNVLLVNLLIALFSNTIDKINHRSIALWHADRYNMINEYKRRSVLPPPFNIVTNAILLITAVFRKCKGHINVKKTTEASNKEKEFLLRYLITQAFARLRKGSPHLTSETTEAVMPDALNIRLDTKFDVLEEKLMAVVQQINNIKKAVALKEATKTGNR